MSKIKRFFYSNQSLLLSILSFLILSFAAYRYTIYKKGLWEKDIRSNILEVLVGKKSNLEKALYSRIYFTRGIAGYASLNPDLTNDEFYALAVEYIKKDSVINSMALSKNCILSNIYPLEGHEEALGLNLLEHPERKEIVEKTIETHETFVAGPVELVEGGIAFISYTPVFDKTKFEEEFWGVCDIVLLRDRLLNEASVFNTENEIEYALKGYNGSGDTGEVFWGNPQVFEKDPVTVKIDLPYGNWVLAATTTKGWENFADQDKVLTIILFLCVFIISILIWLFANAIVKLRKSERNLREANATKDKLFSIIAHDLKNPLGSFIGLTEVVVEEYDVLPDDKKKNILSSILDSAENVYTLLENLLFWAKSQQKSLQYNPGIKKVLPLLVEVYYTFITSAKLKGIELTKNCLDNAIAFMDENLTKTILRNLVSNAIKFTKKGGKVEISCKETNVDNKSFLSISVSDSGIGIRPEQIEQIYQSTRTISTPGTNNETGTGLGLILAQEFAIKQDGKLIIESTQGKGSVFSLLLPIGEMNLSK